MTSFVRSFGHAISAYVNVHHAPRRRHGKLKRATRARVHPIDRPRVIGISSNLHTRTRRVKRSQASSFRRCLRKLGHIRVVCLSSIRFLVPTTFLSVSVFIFFSFISSARTDRILLGRRIFLLRWPRHEYTKLLRETFSLIATASLSPCYIRGLPFSQGFCNLNIQTCLAPIFVSLVSIFIYRVLITDPFHSSLLPSTFQFLHPGFTFYVSFRCFSFPLLFLPVFLFKQKEGRKKKSRIPGQRFQGSVTSLTNWLPRIQPSLPRSCCSTDRAAILRRFAYPSRLVEKRHQESSLESA